MLTGRSINDTRQYGMAHVPSKATCPNSCVSPTSSSMNITQGTSSTGVLPFACSAASHVPESAAAASVYSAKPI